MSRDEERRLKRGRKDTYLPRLEGTTWQSTRAIVQLSQGCDSVTLQRTRRELHSLQAFFARTRFGTESSPVEPEPAIE